MTTSPRTIDESATLARTVETMETLEITTLIVTGKNPKGYIDLHDIFGRAARFGCTFPTATPE